MCIVGYVSNALWDLWHGPISRYYAIWFVVLLFRAVNFIYIILVKLIFKMLTVHGHQHSFSTHKRIFLWNCRSFEIENISTWGGLEPSTFRFMPNALTIPAIRARLLLIEYWLWRDRYLCSKVNIWNVICSQHFIRLTKGCSCASLAFVKGVHPWPIHPWPMDSSHNRTLMRTVDFSLLIWTSRVDLLLISDTITLMCDRCYAHLSLVSRVKMGLPIKENSWDT